MEQDISVKKSTIWKGVAVVAILLVAFVIYNGFRESPTGSVVKSVDGLTEVKTTLQGFQYNPDTITVKKGTTVRLTIENKDNVNHGLHLMQFGIMDSIPALSTKTVEFTAIETPINGQATPTCSQEHGETLTINVI